MFNRNRAQLDLQIEVFISWGLRNKRICPSAKEWLIQLGKYTKKKDVYDITDQDVEDFKQMVYDTTISNYALIRADRAVNSFRRYYMTRTKPTIEKRGKGRPPKVDKILKVQEYRKKGITFRDIATLLDANVSLVHRWAKYRLDQVN